MNSPKSNISWPDTTLNMSYIFLLMGGVLLLFLFSIALGSVEIPLSDIVSILFMGESGNEAWVKIVHNIRLPRAVTAILAGSALSIGGLQMQTLFAILWPVLLYWVSLQEPAWE